MPDFTPDIAADLLATIRNGHEDVAGAFRRALDNEFQVSVSDASPLDRDAVPESWRGPGLAVAFTIGDSGALLFLPAASGLLPDWCATPDAVDAGKLTTLAQELGVVLLPEAFTASESKAVYASDFSSLLPSCEPADSSVVLPITLTHGEQSGVAHFIMPIRQPMAVESAAEPAHGDEVETTPQPPATDAPAQPDRRRIQYTNLDDGLRQLPTYAKSLLKVRVPVTVSLSSTKQSVEQILRLGPGSILQFDKPCEENLELEVGGQTIAEGEAVKVGDKFGLWITSMTTPGERFWVVNGKRSGARAQ